MTNWKSKPPTYKEWRGSGGFWWIRFILMPETTEMNDEGNMVTWPETWHDDIVSVTMSSDGLRHIMQEVTGEEPDYSSIRLHGTCVMGRTFDLDDKNATKGMLWQKVQKPLEDE